MDLVKKENFGLDNNEEVAEDSLTGEAEAEEKTEEDIGQTHPEEVKPQIGLEEHEIIDDSARMYLHEIGRVPLRKRVEEMTLSSKIEQGR